MNKELTIFEGNELEILTKEDINVEFNGECLFNGKQVCGILEYKNDRDAISTKVRENQKIKIKNSDVANHDFRKLNNAGETFLTENGVMRLILNSNMPKANEFEDKVWEIVKEVQATGKYDSIEQQLKLIEDETERNLKLTIYQYEGIVKINPSDILSGMMLNNKKNELNTYLQSKEIEKLKGVVDDVSSRIGNICIIGDRKQFVNEVNSVSRATGKEQSEIYTLTYKQLLDDYGIDLKQRCNNEKAKIQEERLSEGKKPLSPSTLKSRCSALSIADSLELWGELGKSLFVVKDKLLGNKHE